MNDYELNCRIERPKSKKKITGSYPRQDTLLGTTDGELTGPRIIGTYPKD